MQMIEFSRRMAHKLCNTVRRQFTRWLAMYEAFNSAGIIRVPSSDPETVINKLENKRTSTASGMVGFIANIASDGWSKSRRCRIFKERLQCSDAVRTLVLRAMVGIRGCQAVFFGGVWNKYPIDGTAPFGSLTIEHLYLLSSSSSTSRLSTSAVSPQLSTAMVIFYTVSWSVVIKPFSFICSS